MPPNVKLNLEDVDILPLPPSTEEGAVDSLSRKAIAEDASLTALLDMQSDTNGLSKINGEDWTDVKHSERKHRDRILPDGVVYGLMQKSDYEGFKRLFENLAILVLTAFTIALVDFDPLVDYRNWQKVLVFLPLYVFYGFQFQCFAFAGSHEFLHGNAWKTKKYNNYAMFMVGLICFEFPKHERLMHKQHHTFTNNIDKDPELTSFFSREELENANFKGCASSKVGYLRGFFDVTYYFKCRLLRVWNGARGIPVDYSGKGWSMKTPTYSQDQVDDLKTSARMQLSLQCLAVFVASQVEGGLYGLFFWWIIPVVVGYAPINFFRNAEHADCEISKNPNMLRNTRTVESNPLIRQLLWNTNYHVEHHCYPMVPFFNLPKLHEYMDPHITHNECKHFSTQNWAYVRPGGWIDQQQQVESNARAKTE